MHSILIFKERSWHVHQSPNLGLELLMTAINFKGLEWAILVIQKNLISGAEILSLRDSWFKNGNLMQNAYRVSDWFWFRRLRSLQQSSSTFGNQIGHSASGSPKGCIDWSILTDTWFSIGLCILFPPFSCMICTFYNSRHCQDSSWTGWHPAHNHQTGTQTSFDKIISCLEL